MAHATQDTTVFSDSTGQELKEQAVESTGGEVEAVVAGQTGEGSPSALPVAGPDAPAEKAASQTSTDAQSTEPPSRPSLIPLGSTHTQSSTLTPVAPHPKRFSSVSINKKFLEKNTASGSAAASSSSSTSKAGSPSTRPSAAPTSSHSRLVTAKLTASPAVASSTAGWSRPSSVAPSTAGTSSPISTSPLPTAPTTQLSTTSAPQLPHAGKVILPQPRAAMTQLVSQKEHTAPKPVWGNVKQPAAASTRQDIQPNDFPTAAEVAHSSLLNSTHKQAKADEAKATSESAKQLRSEEADTFRGVHLDPNAHHWDEEEDDDNFLDGVIEFGDGRQYKIESNDQAGPSGPQGARPTNSDGTVSSGSVSKEERFVDDFDRSWPKSRTSPASAPRDFPSPAPQSASLNVSPVISHAAHSPQDSSRVLFNERSNRLEPYSQSHRPGQGPFSAKRPGFQEGSSPVESRHAPHNVQVLQKAAPSDLRSRRFSSTSNNGPANGFVADRTYRRDVPPHSPRMTRDLPPHTTERDLDADRGRRTSMGPPPLPSHAMKQEAGRQLPPHLSQVSPNIPTRRLSSRDSRFSPSEASVGLPSNLGCLPPQSPAVSHSSLLLVSPAVLANIPLPLSAPELDEVRKDVMHTAAERAKQRRQHEEAEREAQKERARRKAAEIEEKMKAKEAEKQKSKEHEENDKLAKENEAISFIEAAVKSVEVTPPVDEMKTDTKPTGRPPPLKITRAQAVAEPSTSTRGAIPPRNAPPSAVIPTPATQAPSWRARTTQPPPATPRQIQPRPAPSTPFISSTPSAAEQVETIAGESKDDLEVVDFSDMGKFVGVHEGTATALVNVPEEKSEYAALSKLSRPLASDFFDEPVQPNDTVPDSKKAEFGAWRRKVSQDVKDPTIHRPTTEVKAEVVDNDKKVVSNVQAATEPSQDQPEPMKEQPEPSSTSTNGLAAHLDQNHALQQAQTSPTSHLQRAPRGQTSYKEANMSALDDAMSRIKGVLVGMHAHEPAKEATPNNGVVPELQSQRPVQNVQQPTSQTPMRAPKDRWVPPPLRPRRFDEHDEPREVFLYTVLQLPPSPETSPFVKLPSASRPMGPVQRKRFDLFIKRPFQARLDILSFDPPVPDMNRRDLSLNDVLFGKPPPAHKAKFKHRVLLPQLRGGPKVSIPNPTSAKLNGVGAFGRPIVADGASTWRKPAPSPAIKSDFDVDGSGLDTTSRSPPPQHTPPESTVASIPKASESSPPKFDGNASTRPRPKMPEGSAVAFRRDSRIDVVEADTKPLVNFIVGSQLEESSPVHDSKMTIVANGPSEQSKTAVNGVISTKSSEEKPLPSPVPDNDPKSSEISTAQVLVTPPTHHSSASWARSSISLTIKDSPARAPDPEHLKAVWSQSSNKAGLHAINSLEGIADDLTALPFTLQEMKSEDGETPPPSLPTAPSRMSLHDVTRAFQTVPTSSSTSSQPPHRSTFSPPSTQAPVARPIPTTPSYTYSPVPQNNMRPPGPYVSYPSPMMSHSPAPVMYGVSSPVPSRMQMNGHTPLYSQPMWVTVPPQTHGNMMRPIPMPYQPQMMGYASPGYAPQPIPVTPTSQNGSRGRGMQMISPVMAHAHAHPGPAMYGGSPVMLHTVQVPQNHSYAPTGRGQPRTDNGHMPGPTPGQQQHVHHPASHGGYNAGPTSSLRSQW